MAAPLPFSESEACLLRALLKREVRFMVVGLSAATLQGAPVVTQDVDLWFENLGEAWERDRNNRATTVHWRFTTENARIKLKRLYPKILVLHDTLTRPFLPGGKESAL